MKTRVHSITKYARRRKDGANYKIVRINEHGTKYTVYVDINTHTGDYEQWGSPKGILSNNHDLIHRLVYEETLFN